MRDFLLAAGALVAVVSGLGILAVFTGAFFGLMAAAFTWAINI